ncbi:hypothetical protein [Paucisalibacillus sp. EB02]|uniref:hypothetical protein n=1 Tax=Paucisalibacillus sp. EB02 TaxID=1347087 RepID=UPI0004BBF100|nr:hypothetical protein [Paucisalibacillus sp. EB02]
MVCITTPSGFTDEQNPFPISANVTANISDGGTCITFTLTNTTPGSAISDFYFNLDIGLGVTLVEGPDTTANWDFTVGGPFPGCGGIMNFLRYRFSTDPSTPLGFGQSATLQVCRTTGTFTEEDLEGTLAAVHVRSAGPNDASGCASDTWQCTNVPPEPPVDECPLVTPVVAMENALAELLAAVTDNSSIPNDLPTIEKILKLIFLKNQLLVLLIQECPIDDNDNGPDQNGGQNGA